MNIKKILLSVAMVGGVATQAMASHAENVKAELAFGRASAAQQEQIADGLLTRDTAVRERLVEKHSCSAALRGARIDIDTYESIGRQRFHLPTRVERDEWKGREATLSRRITGLEEVEEALTCQRDELQGRVIAMIQQVEVCEQLAAIVAAQVHEVDPTYHPPTNLHDPEVLKALLEKAKSLKPLPSRAAKDHEAWDDDFVRISPQDGA